MFGVFRKKPEKPQFEYYSLLAQIHDYIAPQSYVEIGVREGFSLRLARTARVVIGIDPEPRITGALPAEVRIFAMTSDEFFARCNLTRELGGRGFDLAFIDGKHLFEFVLRDFINLERVAAADSTILVHDCYPLDRLTSQRERVTDFWSGDVWKLVICLKKYRPDLRIATIDVAPTGLAVIRGLDCRSRLLADRLEQLCEEYIQYDFDQLENNPLEQLNLIPYRWRKIKSFLNH